MSGEHHREEQGHDHGSELREISRKRLVIALVLTASFLVVEVVAGIVSGSLALLSDAGHMLTDAGALGLALWAQAIGARPRSDRKTFGYRRAEILAAAANGVVLGITAVAVIVEAVRRFASPPQIQGYPMLAVAVVGLGINLVAGWVLSQGASHDLNLRAAATHVMADAAGSVAAIVAAILILALGWTMADPIASVLISVLILFGAWRLLRDATNVLMEGAPPGIDVAALERLARETAGVRDVHDLHVWSIVGDAPVITAHVLIAPGAHGVEVARDVGLRIETAVGRRHVTVQPEATPPEEQLLPPSTLVRTREVSVLPSDAERKGVQALVAIGMIVSAGRSGLVASASGTSRPGVEGDSESRKNASNPQISEAVTTGVTGHHWPNGGYVPCSNPTYPAGSGLRES